MKWMADLTQPKSMHFVIKKDTAAGFYLYVYQNGQDIYDDLQDTLEWAMTVAFEDFGVPKDAWKKVEE